MKITFVNGEKNRFIWLGRDKMLHRNPFILDHYGRNAFDDRGYHSERRGEVIPFFMKGLKRTCRIFPVFLWMAGALCDA